MFLVLPVTINTIPVIKMVVVAINTVSIVILSSYINVRLYPLALSTIKLKLTLPLLSSGSI
jgi:hypothetical protein